MVREGPIINPLLSSSRRPRSTLSSFILSFAFFLPAGAFGVELFGAGSPEVALAFSTLAEDYLFTRDDVRYPTPTP